MKNVAIVAMLLITIASLALSQAKPGGIARELAMGGSQAGTNLVLNPFIMDDPALIFVNPAYQAMYKDYGWLNVAGGAVSGLSFTGGSIGDDGWGHQNAGVAFGLNSDWALGVLLSYDPSFSSLNNSLISPIVQTSGGRASQAIPGIQNTWEAIVSMHGGNLDLGLGVMYGWSNNDTKVNQTSPAAGSETEASASLWGFRGGVNVNLGGNSTLDLSGALRMDKATDKKTNNFSPINDALTGEYSASTTELQFTGRAKFDVSSKFNFVPYGMFLTASGEPKEETRPNGVTTTPNALKATVTAFAFGAGGEYHVGSFYLAGGLSYQSAQVKLEQTPSGGTTSTLTEKYSAIPVMNLGMEWTLTDWLTGRGGYTRSLGSINIKSESTTGSVEQTLSLPMSFVSIGAINPATWDGMVTLGVGLKFGGFALDATVSDEALRRGLGLIGAQDNINTFGYMTASYYFGE